MIAPLGNYVQRAIKSLRTRLWQGTLRSQVQPRPHPNFARLESSYRFLVSLYASSRESLLYFRGTFSPLRLILSLKSVFSFLSLFFYADFRRYAKKAERTPDARPPWHYHSTGEVDTRRAFPRI